MVLAMNLTAFATGGSTSAVADARSGVIQVRVYYVDNAGRSYYLQKGSGFLVGASSGATTVITNHHVIDITDEDKHAYNAMFQEMGMNVDFFNPNEIDIEYRVAVKRDVEIEAKYVNGSEKADFAILELEQPIYDRTPLKLAKNHDVIEAENIYALGFPSTAEAVEDDSVYTVEDVTITDGIVGKFQTVDNVEILLHNATVTYGNSGGPLVNSNGAVVGINTLVVFDGVTTYSSSIGIDEITSVLKALGIQYEEWGAATPEPDPTPVEPELKPELDSIEIEPTPVEPDPTPVEPEPEPAPEPAPGPNFAIIGGAAAGVVVLIVIIIVVVSSSKKSTKKAPTAPTGAPVPPAGAPVSPVRPAGAPVPPSFGGTMPVDTGAGETSVLGGGAGETSVLGGGAMQPAATLIRKKNGETATIAKQLFVIGKERSKVDFCIPDNNSVSRNHANIVCKGGVYYIVDKNSTNFTFVNGNKITPNQEVKLNSGDKIKLADEEFEFRM